MKRKIIRLCVFLLGFVWLIIFANTFLIKTDTYARLTLAELQERDDIQVAFVGSSIVRDHFNAEMISEQTGFTCFSVGGSASRSRRHQGALSEKQSGMDDSRRRAVHV